MDTLASLNHSVWDCKYHVVFIPKCRRRTLYGDLRRHTQVDSRSGRPTRPQKSRQE
jgi:REP element-mobilizing transposase RayT